MTINPFTSSNQYLSVRYPEDNVGSDNKQPQNTQAENNGRIAGETDKGGEVNTEDKSNVSPKKNNPSEFSTEERVEISQMVTRDREVRTHESAHIAAGGRFVKGGATYSYKTGHDGKKYAVGGEVSIDSSKASGDPGETIQKARVIRRAALAPASPSAQDRQVAAKASQMENEAKVEMVAQKREEKTEKSENTDNLKNVKINGPEPGNEITETQAYSETEKQNDFSSKEDNKASVYNSFNYSQKKKFQPILDIYA